MMPEKSLSELDGEIKFGVLRFICPVCDNGHSIRVYFNNNGVGKDPSGNPIWKHNGEESIEKISLYPDVLVKKISLTPSINCNSSCKFHGWIKDGKVIW